MIPSVNSRAEVRGKRGFEQLLRRLRRRIPDSRAGHRSRVKARWAGSPQSNRDGNVANVVNNRGQVAGVSAMSGNTTTHAFLWTKERGKMLDLGTLSGDVNSAALGINDRSEVVGASFGAAGPINGNPRAFLWKDGVMTDLNDLVPANSPLHLLTAFGINDAGDIAGFGVTSSGDLHAFLATPCDR